MSRLLLLAMVIVSSVFTSAATLGRYAPVRIVEEQWQRVDRVVPNAPKPEVIWSGEPLVHPRGIMLDPVNEVLYVTDPGEPDQHPQGKPARIVTFDVMHGIPASPEIFYSDPEFMISAKWGFPMTIDGRTQVLVADQGESDGGYSFTGKGAKVFTIPVLEDGTAGEPRIIWEGSPFVCPTGIAAIEDLIYITDPCAGPIRTIPERPDQPFPSSAIFGLRLDGTEPPIVLKSGAPFTSLIGICILTPGEIIVNDTDSGPFDPTATGGRPSFAPPGGADRWVLQILDEEQPALSDPVRTPFLEEGPITLEFSAEAIVESVARGGTIRIEARGDSRLMPLRPDTIERVERVERADVLGLKYPVTVAEVNPERLAELNPERRTGGVRLTVNVASNVHDREIALNVIFPGGDQIAISQVKQHAPVFGLFDNKHGGAEGGGFGGGGAGGTFLRFSTDNTPGHGSIIVYRDEGGSFAILAQGAPLERPVSAQLNADGNVLWIVDQANGTMFSLAFPSPETFFELFPRDPSERQPATATPEQ